eukprot:CAMPEP_0175104200 /NCGR_PEP_ID=MMETSP0086_2-20121207/9568_1 /TAXON_ID=136419 /ORGANISM="Unknown Unknown, Strain D1" /LENGTH=89 /DNA_ID=CAMNT_0016379511 /DNA_START=15 /DNA_END=284 /DNA_ORIENTATION=+
MAEEAKKLSQAHQRWMLELLKGKEGGKVSYEELVQVGEEHHCDTVGAMLKILKNKKVIKYDQMFLMYPMHKDEIITLADPDVNIDEVIA